MIKSAEEIQRMSVAGALTAKVLEALDEVVRPGISTAEIDRFCERYIVDTLAAIPGSKGQYGYPFTVNTSVNEVVCHGWPSAQQILRDGDIVNVDVTVIKDGYFGDSSKMYRVGAIDRQAQKLLDVTRECLYRAIRVVRPDATLGDIGHAIQSHAEANGYSVVREYCGHGIGRKMHEAPQVLHFGRAGAGCAAEGRDDLHHRTDDQPGRPRGEAAQGRLDRDHPRPPPVGPVRAHRAGHRAGLPGPDPARRGARGAGRPGWLIDARPGYTATTFPKGGWRVSGRRFGEFELRATWLREDSGYLAEIEITSIDDGRTEWLVLPGQPPCESPAAALSLAEAALYRVRGFDARGRPLFSD
ncbi:methionine aminopeptidase [Pseudomonas aeruginosa]|nr:methionine aminopeptidase [Pseudomonas aeruginosa]